MRYDDFTPGLTFQSRTRTLTETDLVIFAGLSGDYLELHTSEEYASGTRFGRRIAHGALVFSISTGLSTQMNLVNDIVTAFIGVEHLRFVDPVFVGDTLRLTKRVLERREVGRDQGLLRFDTRVINQHGKPVLAYVDKLLVHRPSCRNTIADPCLTSGGDRRHDDGVRLATAEQDHS